MKKIISLSLFISLIINLLNAEPVDTLTARRAAANFLAQHQTAAPARGSEQLQLAEVLTDSQNLPCVYVFNQPDGGFVVMAADDCVLPVLGYSTNGHYDAADVPANMSAWLLTYRDAVSEIAADNRRQHNLHPTMATQWQTLLENTPTAHLREVVVEPLLVTTWGQQPYYNALCPTGENGRAITGCVATAMGQIMRYWQHPAQGHGSHTHVCNYGAYEGYEDYGALFVDYSSATYNYSLMPAALTSTSPMAQVNEVAKLLYHCGVSVNMMYSPDGSGANSEDVPGALRKYFGYSCNNFTYKNGESSWINLLKACLDQGQPIYYSGSGDDGGHAFVCDGYDEDNYFHFNWGWRGSYDAYFAVSNLNPSSYVFNTYQGAIFNLHPDPCYPYEEISISGNPVMADATSSVTLQAPEGMNYHWSNNATTQTITVSPTVPKLYSVTVTDSEGCHLVASQWVTFADGCELTFFMHDSFGDSWQGNAIQIFNHVQKIAEITLEDGAYDTLVVPVISGPLALKWKNGSFPEECSFEVTGNCFHYAWETGPSGVFLETEMFCGEIATEFNAVCTESSYEWNGETYTQSGDYTQTFTSAAGCDSTVTLHLTFDVGVDEAGELLGVQVWPNPTSGVVNIDFGARTGICEVAVFDVCGKQVLSAQGANVQIDLSPLATGIYVLKFFHDGNFIGSTKVLREM